MKKPKLNKTRGEIIHLLASCEFTGSNLIGKTDLLEKLVLRLNLDSVSERTLGINSCGLLIKSMPLDQAIHIMKSDITGLPETQVIEGELVVAYVR